MSTNPQPTSEKTSKPKVLFVDDEPFLLEGLRRALYREFDTDLANGPEEGLSKIQSSVQYPVVVSDMRMPGMDGAEFLARVRTIVPDTIRVMLTGHADVEAAMRAVNEGRIFRFLNKPVTPEDLTLTLRACVAQYHLVRTEKELLENTLAGAVRVLSEVLNLANPAAFNCGTRVRQYVSHIAGRLGLGNNWQYEIAAMLSELGCVTFPPDLLEAVHAGQTLSAADQQRYSRHTRIAHDLLVRIPRLDLVAKMILQQNDPPSLARPIDMSAEIIGHGAQMLKVSLAYDRMISGGTSKSDALAQLSQNAGEYDRKYIAALEDFQPLRQATELRAVDVRDLRVGMILNEDLRNVSGVLLAAKGQEVSYVLVKTVRNFADNNNVKGTIRVIVNAGEPWLSKAAAR